MYLKKLKLRDWKSYTHLELTFPEPSNRKNVVLIGANNGFGKTSLLEALLVGIFGKDAHHHVGRALKNSSWSSFLERAFNARASESGRHSMSIEVTLEDELDGPTVIQRVWHFTPARKHKAGDDEIRIYQGEERELIEPHRLEEEPDDFYRSVIVKHFLPVDLAQFFLFDGEQVQALARQSAQQQVKAGLDGLLGVHILRRLQDDLRAYASQQQKQTRSLDSKKLQELNDELERLESSIKEKERLLHDTEKAHKEARQERDRAILELGSLSGGTQANMQELMTHQENLRRDEQRTKAELANLIQGDLTITLSGSPLLRALAGRLELEHKQHEWETSRNAMRPQLQRLLELIQHKGQPFEPPLTHIQRRTLEERVTDAWDTLWAPPPGEKNLEYRHPYLSPQDRQQCLMRMEKLEQTRVEKIEDLLHMLNRQKQELNRCSNQIAQQDEGSSERTARLTEHLQKVSQEVERLAVRTDELKRTLEGETARRRDLNASLGRLQGELKEAEPQLKRAALARKVVELVDDLLKEAAPRYNQRLGEEMTTIYRQMAHKRRVEQIEISPDCEVKMLAAGGRELRSTLDSSAGEDQIFALALISAIAEVSECVFPLVMDTPLARLDTQHRLNVLRYFTTDTKQQVILLSTPEEVHGQFLDAIRDRVCAAWRIEHEEYGNGIGDSRMKQGYFERL
ncbi:MAG: DNA sulfur modification protein DndD [Myxococcota bacterium]